jgi:hypothetical protein
MPAPPDRAFSFTDWQVSNPTAPPPGDKLDAEFDRTNQAVEDQLTWTSASLNSDGSIRDGIIGENNLVPGLFDDLSEGVIDDVQPLVDTATNAAGAAQASASAAAASATSAAGANTAAQGANTAAQGAAGDARLSAANAQGANTAAQGAAGDARLSVANAQGASALAQDYADVTQAWAEHMPDTIPPNILAVMGISGDHWSSRWWANRAAQIALTTGGLVTASPAPPANPFDGQLWWDSVGTQLYIYYNDGNSKQWVAASNYGAGAAGLGDAPSDGTAYGRLNAAWSQVLVPAVGTFTDGGGSYPAQTVTPLRMSGMAFIGSGWDSQYTTYAQSPGTGTWIKRTWEGLRYLEKGTQLRVGSAIGGAAALFFSRQSDNGQLSTDPSVIGTVSFSYNDVVGTRGSWGHYLEAHRIAGAGPAIGQEIEVVTHGDDVVPVGPYGYVGGGTPRTLAFGLGIGCGGDSGTAGTGPTYNAGNPIYITPNPNRFKLGITFLYTSLVRDNPADETSPAHALLMGKGHQIEWHRDVSGNPSSYIRSDNDGTIKTALLFKADGLYLTSAPDEVPIAGFFPVANAVNYLRHTGAAAGFNPQLQCGGSDPNISLNLAGKGTGGVRLLDGTPTAQVVVSTAGTAIQKVGFNGTAPIVKPTITGARGGVLNTPVAAVGNGADTTEDTLQTFSVPANTLRNVGDRIRIVAGGTMAASTDSRIARIRLGALIYAQVTATIASTTTWRLECDVVKTANNAQMRTGVGLATSAGVTTINGADTLTDTGALSLTVTGQNTTNSVASSVVCNYLLAEALPITPPMSSLTAALAAYGLVTDSTSA